MELSTQTRYLVHGMFIDLNNLHELLYFDALTCSDKKLIVINNKKDKKSVDKLLEKKLIVHRNTLLSEIPILKCSSIQILISIIIG